MVVTSIMTTEAEITQKAGAGASASFTEAMKDAAVLQAESVVNTATKYNWSDWFAGSPNADVKGLQSSIVSSLVAIDWILYDFAGYPSRIVAEDMINVLRDLVLRNLSILRDKPTQKFIQETDT